MTSFFGRKTEAESTNTATPQFAKVLRSVGAEMFSFGPGQVLELKAGATHWPAPIAGWIERPGDEPLIEVLPTPPAWFLAWSGIRPILIDPLTFRVVPPPPPPKPALLTLPDVVALTGLDADAIEVAASLGFPKPCSSREFHRDGAQFREPLWNSREIALWLERQQVVRRG